MDQSLEKNGLEPLLWRLVHASPIAPDRLFADPGNKYRLHQNTKNRHFLGDAGFSLFRSWLLSRVGSKGCLCSRKQAVDQDQAIDQDRGSH